MTSDDLILIKPHTHDLGSFNVLRVLPNRAQKMIGPFIFFDHFGPTRLAPGGGVDVRPHPHIGLATVTYLFEGAFLHRDSLGTIQPIAPGDVNWMTAGRGIVHSERTPPEARPAGPALHGIQTWVALPKTHEQTAPGFSHHRKLQLPRMTEAGIEMTLIAGSAFGATAPTPTFSPIFYLAVTMQPGTRLELPAEHEERGIYVVEGSVSVAGQPIAPQHLVAVIHKKPVTIEAATSARVMLIGGARMDGDRFIWWNFVASSRELIEEAKAQWQQQRFAPVPDETEFIPLPVK